MMTVHSSGEAGARDLMNRAVPVLVRGFKVIGEVLIQTAARVKPEHLHPEADSQDRHLRTGSLERVEELEFEGLSHRIDERGLGVNGVTETRGVGVVTTAEDHAVEMGQQGFSRPGERKQGDRDATALGD